MLLHCQLEIPMFTGDPRDRVTWSFNLRNGFTDRPTPSDIQYLGTLVTQGFTVDPTPAGGTSTALGAFLSPAIDNAFQAALLNVYEVVTPGQLAETEPLGSPLGVAVIDTGVPIANEPPLPHEVAVVTRFDAPGRALQPAETPDGSDPGTLPDRPRSRYTGRTYVGPFNTAAIGMTTSNLPAVDGECLESIADFWSELSRRLTTDPGLWAPFELAIWSRQDATFRAASAILVDAAWDTQRRRGIDNGLPQANRSLFTLP